MTEELKQFAERFGRRRGCPTPGKRRHVVIRISGWRMIWVRAIRSMGRGYVYGRSSLGIRKA